MYRLINKCPISAKIPVVSLRKKTNLIAQYWLVPGTDSSMIYKKQNC